MVEKKPGQLGKKLSYNPDDFNKAHTRLQVMFGNEQNILRIFQQDVTNHPDDPMAHYRYGLILSKSGNRAEAVTHFKKALEKKAFDPDILRDLGRTYFLDGRYSEAQKTLEGAISLFPDEPEVLFFLGRIRMETGNLKEAEELFSTIATKHPYYKQALYFLGETFGKMGNMADAHYYLGLYYSGKDDIRNAGFHLEKALQETVDQDRKIKIEEILYKIKKIESKEAKNEPEKTPKPNRPNFIK